ncbi:hypothetical protein HDU79_009664 [Rhizoclosmatium sp. JEL0117]|nr:hypothetical protein HDU79_009664 [Rhizoclosmatium sp. JEL0117]
MEDGQNPETPAADEITAEDLEAHFAAEVRREQRGDVPETDATDSNKPATGESSGSGNDGGAEDSDEKHENKAIGLLQSIVEQHTTFDEAKEEEEIAALVKIALEDPPAQTPDQGDDQREMTEDEKILQQVKNTIRFLQENIANPNTYSEDFSHAQVGDKNFDVRMRAEYENLYRLFITARRNNQGLVKKLRDMKNEIISNATKVEAAMKIFQEDRVVIASLRKELKKAWSVVEMTKDRELKAKDTAFNLKFEIDNLKKELAKATGNEYHAKGSDEKKVNMVQMNLELQMKIDQLERDKVELNKKNQVAHGDIKVLNGEISELNEKLSEEKKHKEHAIHEMDLVNKLLQTKKSEQDRESRIRDKLEAAIDDKSSIIDKKNTQITEKLVEMKGLKDIISRLEMQVKDEKLKVEKEISEKQAAISRVIQIQSEMEVQRTKFSKSKSEAAAHNNPSEDHELYKCKEQIKSLTRANDMYQKQAKAFEEAKLAAEIERDAVKGTNYSLSRETDSIKKQLDGCMRQIEMLTKERDSAQKNFVKATGATQRQFNAVKLSDQAQRTLEHEIVGFKEEAAKMRKLIYSLEKERDYHMTEYAKMQADMAEKDEELKMKQMLVFDGQKKIAELQRKRKEQQQLYETVRTDRNTYSKNLIECEDEITELKRKLKIMGHQIEQLKEEISVKESDLAKGHFEHNKLEKEKEALSLQIAKLQNQLDEAQVAIKNRLAEENKLRHCIAEGDAARAKLRKEYDSIVQARDVLGSQLIRRNEEISLLYEKIKIQTSTLNQGEIQYYERIEDIRVLKLEIKKLRREKAILQTETQNVDGLRNEIFKLHKDVLKERTRVKVLEEELESPMNIHRWRKLSGSDPTMFELITKMQALQKRLILKTEEVVEKETVINQKDKLYLEVKNLLQRQPGPEVLEELRMLKGSMKAKVRECKSLASELNMYHSQVNEYKYEIQRLGQEYQDLKKRYYELKKKDRDDRMLRLRIEQEQVGYGVLNERSALGMGKVNKDGYSLMPPTKDSIPTSLPALKPNVSNGPKFSGGGFNLGRNLTAGDRPLSEAAM